MSGAPSEGMDFPEDLCRLVLVGKTGSGKSSTGNTILGSPQFQVGHYCRSVTTTSWWTYGTVLGVKVEIADTPGIFDTEIDDATVCKEIVKTVACTAPGPHAVLFVIRTDVRFTGEEAAAVTYLRRLFGDDIVRHMIIVFTHGDNFPERECFRRNFLPNLPPEFARFLQEADGRCVLFNNKEKDPGKNQEQVRELLMMVRTMLQQLGNKPFVNPMLLRCQETIVADAGALLRKLAPQLGHSSCNLLRAALNGKENAEQLLHDIMDTRDSKLQGLREKIKKLEEGMTQKDLTNEDLHRLLKEREKANQELENGVMQKEMANQGLQVVMRQKEATILKLEETQEDLLRQLKELQEERAPKSATAKKRWCSVL